MEKIDYQQFYSREAAQYEATRYGSRYGNLFRRLQRGAVKRALEFSDSSSLILDVATGTGQMLPVLRAVGDTVVASDLTPAMLVEARKVAVGLGGGVSYCVGDALKLPYQDNQFDVVASSRFLHLFDREVQAALVKEMARVLRPGGLLVVDFYSAHGRLWVWLPMVVYRALLRKRPEHDVRVTLGQARQMLRNAGLAPVMEEGVGNYLLAFVAWLPTSWRLRIGEWFGKHFIRMSEQFLIASRAPR